MYYVGFSSATAVASLILFQGFHTTHATDAASLLCGFAVTFLGVHLLNLSRRADSLVDRAGHSALDGGLLNPRMNISGRMSLEGWNGVAEAAAAAPSARRGHSRGNSGTLFNAYEEGLEPTPAQESVVLHSLNEEDESEEEETEEEETDVDERTQLRKTTGRNASYPQQNNSNHSRNSLHNHHQSQRPSASRSHSSSPLHSPRTPRTMGGSVRIP